MAKQVSRLTDRAVRAIPANSRDAVYWDGELTGFGVRVRASGRKTWVFQTRVRGRLRWFTLGRCGAPGTGNKGTGGMGADDARAQAQGLAALAKQGIDPREGLNGRGDEQEDGQEDGQGDARGEEQGEPSVADLGRRFLEDYVPLHCKPRTQAHYRRMVEKFIVPGLGDMAAAEVRRKHAAELHHSLRATPYQANRMLGVLSKMFTLAEVWGWRPDGTNPCRHIRQYKEHKRERFLSPEEMARLGAALRAAEEEMPSAVAAIRLLLLTGCRMSEIRDLRWEHVTADAIELPDAKTGGRAVPLSPEARAVLAALPREAGNPWVFPGRFPGTHRANLQRPWEIIRGRAGLDDVRIHDLRHSFASRALALGESLTMIGKLLGHTQVQTTARYAHLARNSIQNAAARIADSIGDSLDDRLDGRLDKRGGSPDAARPARPADIP
ncbi:MAG: site-specific integrase [Rhodospirillaceae bacterium]|nr:site-specific integrase [Rhodospirillaceae bacterium]MYB13005.1 site-specific integrase [Rhodospirillaceae bacterium]MYI50859.1 site-specific integrase [Rhodospirillaceae bacterium]